VIAERLTAQLRLAQGDRRCARERIVAGGVFRPILLVDGRAVGTWRLTSGEVEPEPLGRLGAALSARLSADAEAVVSYLRVSFPSSA
jgi:hypothetical protein